MKKLPNLFERDWNGDKSRVLPELNRSADVAWALSGEGAATVKWDGSAVMVRDGRLFVRYDCKRGKAAPPDFEPCQDEDPVTGHRPGWIPALGNPAAKWHLDAFLNAETPHANGTYEACGPQLQSNPYRFPRNLLIRHGADVMAKLLFSELPTVAHGQLAAFLANYRHQHQEMPEAMGIEGIVWHHPDGRMVKVLASDLGVPWKAKART